MKTNVLPVNTIVPEASVSDILHVLAIILFSRIMIFSCFVGCRSICEVSRNSKRNEKHVER